MNQRKDNYRAALQRGQAEPGPRTPTVTTLTSRYVRITSELDPVVQRNLGRWVAPPVALLANTGAAAMRVLAAVVARTPPGL